MMDAQEIAEPYFETIFEEELNSWHRLVDNWPTNHDFKTFLAWFPEINPE